MATFSNKVSIHMDPAVTRLDFSDEHPRWGGAYVASVMMTTFDAIELAEAILKLVNEVRNRP